MFNIVAFLFLLIPFYFSWIRSVPFYCALLRFVSFSFSSFPFIISWLRFVSLLFLLVRLYFFLRRVVSFFSFHFVSYCFSLFHDIFSSASLILDVSWHFLHFKVIKHVRRTAYQRLKHFIVEGSFFSPFGDSNCLSRLQTRFSYRFHIHESPAVRLLLQPQSPTSWLLGSTGSRPVVGKTRFKGSHCPATRINKQQQETWFTVMVQSSRRPLK